MTHGNKNRPIAVFDSGVGGVSVLRELIRLLPEEDFIYFGDSAHAPYGVKPLEQVRQLTLDNAALLLDAGAKALVVACNTATSAAIDLLRAAHAGLPVVGMEPALKPAVSSSPHPRIAVLATQMTLREEKFARLLADYARRGEVEPLPAPRLVEFVESGCLDGAAVDDYLRWLFAPYDQPFDAVVLGCTHFPFLRRAIRRAIGPAARLYDGGPGTARHTRQLLLDYGLARDDGHAGQVVLRNSSPDPRRLELCRQLLHADLGE